MWFSGGLAALSSLTYPSISAFVSVYAKENQQGNEPLSALLDHTLHLGLVQGMVNGVRGLCNGLGPALFGFTFYLFNVDLGFPSPATVPKPTSNVTTIITNVKPVYSSLLSRDVPGPPFLFGALLATVALMFSLLLPHSAVSSNDVRTIEQKARLMDSNDDVTYASD